MNQQHMFEPATAPQPLSGRILTFVVAELAGGRKHNAHSAFLKGKFGVSKHQIIGAVAYLIESGRLEKRPLPSRECIGRRTHYLHPLVAAKKPEFDGFGFEFGRLIQNLMDRGYVEEPEPGRFRPTRKGIAECREFLNF